MKTISSVIIFLIFITISSSQANEKIWNYESKYLTEECFVNEWISSDNFEEFYDRYSPAVMEAYNPITSEMSDKQKVNFFFQGIGNYYVKYIPLDEKFEASWGDDKLSLTRSLDECSKDKIFKIDRTKDYYELASYKFLEELDLKTRCSLMGSIILSKAKCLDVKTIQYTEVFPAMSPVSQVTVFGIYDYEGKKIILPLKFYVSLPKEVVRTNGIRDDFFEWLSSQNEYSDTNGLIWNEDFEAYLNNAVPKIDLLIGFTGDKKGSLLDSFSSVISGPPDTLKYSDNERYLLASACRAHECSSKGLIWIDTKEKKSIGLIRHAFWNTLTDFKKNQFLLFSKDYEEIPLEFIDSVKNWMKSEEITSPSVIRIVDKKNNIKNLDLSLFN